MANPRTSLLLSSGAALSALLLTASCGGDGGSNDGGGNGGGSGAESPEAQEPLGGEGFVAIDCGEETITAARFSDEDGSLQATHTFNASEATAAAEPTLAQGHAVGSLKSVEFPDCVTGATEESPFGPVDRNQAHELAGILMADESRLLITIVEDVDGTEVRTIGAMSATGEVEALLPREEASEFGDPVHRTSPRYHHRSGTLYYLENVQGEDTVTVKSLSPDSGETTNVSACEEATHCERIVVHQQSGRVHATIVNNSQRPYVDNNYYRYFSSPSGEVIGVDPGSFEVSTSRYEYSGDQDLPPAVWEREGHSATGFPWTSTRDYRIPTYTESGYALFMVNETELMVDTNTFTVVTLNEELEITEDSRDLIPGEARTNLYPIPSADDARILFHSTNDAGESAWYSVPVDGGEEPVEIGPIAPEHASMVPVLWL